MSTNHRKLRPAPSLDGQERAELRTGQQGVKTRRRPPLTAACKGCREKKTRCPGQRPTCEQCRTRAVECIYETLPGETRSASLKLKNDRMRQDLSTMMELYWYLQTRPKEDVANALAAIQTGADANFVMKSLNSSDSSRDALHSVIDKRDGHQAHVDTQDWDLPSDGMQREAVTSTWDISVGDTQSEPATTWDISVGDTQSELATSLDISSGGMQSEAATTWDISSGGMQSEAATSWDISSGGSQSEAAPTWDISSGVTHSEVAPTWDISSGGTQSAAALIWAKHPDPIDNEALLYGEPPESSCGTNPNLLGTEPPATQLPVDQTRLDPSNTIAALKSGVEIFFSCAGHIFHIYDHSEAQELLEAVEPCIKDAGESWPGLMIPDSTPMRLKASLCSVCIMAAIGLQYRNHPITAMGLKPSVENWAYSYATMFYELAKHLMEAAVEDNVLEAIKVCAAMCIYNIICHATIAVANADMGINFALSLGPSFQYCPADFSEAVWVKYKSVTRTLVTLRNWLTATLGYVPGDSPNFRAAIYWLMEQKNLAPNEVIQHELAKVVQLEANLVRTIDSSGDVSPPVICSTSRDLAEWYNQLPQWMHLDALVDSGDLTAETRRTVFLLHLIYLSANILVARLAHSGQDSLSPSYDIEKLRVAAGDGVVAARTASRILQLQLEGQTIFRRCWICEYTSYVSSLILLHSTAQLVLYGYPRYVWEQELSYAKSCLDVLEYCGEVNKVALHFANTTSRYLNILVDEAQKDRDFSAIDMPEKFDYLFGNPQLSATYLVQVSRSLLELLKYPFGKPSNSHTEFTAGASFDSQLDWNAIVKLPFNWSPPKATGSISLIEIALASLRSGHFIGSSQPHGWDSLPNPNSVAQKAYIGYQGFPVTHLQHLA